MHSTGMDISYKFLKLDLHTVFTYLHATNILLFEWNHLQILTIKHINIMCLDHQISRLEKALQGQKYYMDEGQKYYMDEERRLLTR